MSVWSEQKPRDNQWTRLKESFLDRPAACIVTAARRRAGHQCVSDDGINKLREAQAMSQHRLWQNVKRSFFES